MQGSNMINPKMLRRKVERCRAKFSIFAGRCAFRRTLYRNRSCARAVGYCCGRNGFACSLENCSLGIECVEQHNLPVIKAKYERKRHE